MVMRRIFKVSSDFEFVATVLIGMIGHDCTCESCSDNRQRALSALLWLFANNTHSQIALMPGAGGAPELHMRVPTNNHVSVPEEILAAAKYQLEHADLTQEQRAAINGFLAGADQGSADHDGN